ncbi:MAG: LysR family transcriptional regulator [Aeromonadaceae bacterium]
MSHLSHLRTFLEVYRLKSISQAAKQLGLTQPAASLHIQSLEALVGKPLFIRQARGVEATAAADDLARAIAPYLDGLEMKLASFKPGAMTGGTVHIAGPSDFIHSKLAATLAPLIQQGFRLRFHTGNKQKIYELLASNTMDFAITASAPDPHNYEFAHLLTERMLLVYAPAISKVMQSGVMSSLPDPQTLSQVPLIAFDEDLPLVRSLWSTLFQVAPSLQAALTVPDLRIIKELVLQGHGWSVLPDYHCTEELATGSLIAANAAAQAPTNDLYLVWQKRSLKHPGLTFLLDHILKSFAETG